MRENLDPNQRHRKQHALPKQGSLKRLHICHRHETGFGKRRQGSESPSFLVYLAWMPVDAQTNYGSSSAHAQWFCC